MDRLAAMEVFVRVADAGSFTAAARSLGVSKASVSKQVAALEAHLGVELLRRTTRSLTLTDAGRTYRERCRGLLEEVAALEGELRHEHQRPRGLLRVTAPPGFVSRYGALMTSAFLARHPEVQLQLQLTHRLVDLVEEGIDVAIRITEPLDSALVVRKLAPAPIVAVASPDYLRRRGTPRSPAALREHACLVDTNFRDGSRWPFRVDGRLVRVEVEGPVRANSPNLVCDLAVEGHGVALVPLLVAEAPLRRGALVEVLPGTVALDWSVLALYPRRRHLAGRTRAFIEHMAEGLAGASA